MFYIYIDDSGSSPEQKFAIAAAVVFPAKRLFMFEGEWRGFLTKEGIPELHTSKCVAHNPHSPFARWDDARVERVLLRAQEIIFKYSVRAFSIGIHKLDYDEVIPDDMKAGVGNSHYVWALSSVFGLSYDWANVRKAPMEYVLDTPSKEEKRDIEEAIDYSEAIYPGHFSGHCSFRSRKEVAGLQVADLFAWTCYQAGRWTRFEKPMISPSGKLWDAFISRNEGKWPTIQSLNRKGIEMWVKRTYGSPEDLRLREYRKNRKEGRMVNKQGRA